MRIETRQFVLAAAVLWLVAGAGQARAGLVTFDLAYSGAPDGNIATGTGTITFDPSLLSNPGHTLFSATAFSLTIANSGSGNGTFGLVDYPAFLLDTNGGTLDFTKELVGQPAGFDPFGTPFGNGGKFIIFSGIDPNAPFDDGFFTIETHSGDSLQLTSFAPEVNPVPEPATFVSAGIGVLMLMGYAWRKRRRPSVAAA